MYFFNIINKLLCYAIKLFSLSNMFRNAFPFEILQTPASLLFLPLIINVVTF